MRPTAIMNGPADAFTQGVIGALTGQMDRAEAAPADLLIDFGSAADQTIAAAQEFAQAIPVGREALVISLLKPHAAQDWPAADQAARIWAFTRYAALAWAPLRIRVNAIGLGVSPPGPAQPAEDAARAAGAAPAQPATDADIAATILAMARFPSMTGQLIRLGVPRLGA